MTKPSFIVDFQVFCPSDIETVVKELAVASADGSALQHHLFKPPYDFYDITSAAKKRRVWEDQERTGLHWNTGFVPYQSLWSVLTKTVTGGRVYVKGNAKKETLEKLLLCTDVEVLDLDKYGCPTLETLFYTQRLYRECPFGHERECSLKNATALYWWWKEHSVPYDTIEAVGRSIKAVETAGFSNPGREVLRHLPKEFVLNRYGNCVEDVFKDLPAYLQCDRDILMELPCKKHQREDEAVDDDDIKREPRDEWSVVVKRKFCERCNPYCSIDSQ